MTIPEEGVRKTAFTERGAAVDELGPHVEVCKLLCACGGRKPIVAVVHDVGGRQVVEVQRQIMWGFDDLESSGVPTFGWLTLEISEIGRRLPLVCRTCRKLDGVDWALVTMLLNTRPRKLYIRDNGVVETV